MRHNNWKITIVHLLRAESSIAKGQKMHHIHFLTLPWVPLDKWSTHLWFICRDISARACTCLACQLNKVGAHYCSSVQHVPIPADALSHVDMDEVRPCCLCIKVFSPPDMHQLENWLARSNYPIVTACRLITSFTSWTTTRSFNACAHQQKFYSGAIESIPFGFKDLAVLIKRAPRLQATVPPMDRTPCQQLHFTAATSGFPGLGWFQSAAF